MSVMVSFIALICDDVIDKAEPLVCIKFLDLIDAFHQVRLCLRLDGIFNNKKKLALSEECIKMRP